MKRLILSTLTVMALVACVDRLAGYALDHMLPQMGTSEETSGLHHAMNETEAEVVIVGASTSLNNYVPAILHDSLGMSAHICGAHNTDVSYLYAMVNSVLDRYAPRVLLLDVMPEYCCRDLQDNVELLYPFYRKNEYVTQVIDQKNNGLEKVLLQSDLYRYNSVLLRLLVRYLLPQNKETGNGFVPLPAMETETLPHNWMHDVEHLPHVRPEHEAMLKQVVERAKSMGVNVVLAESPVLKPEATHREGNLWVERFAQENELPLLNHVAEKTFTMKYEWFYDREHLSAAGAEEYTKKIASEIKAWLND